MSEPIFTRDALERLDIDVLDKMAFGVVGGEIITLSPSDIVIQYECDLGNPQHKFKQGGMAWAHSVDLSTPVEVSVDNNGAFLLEDGHHRWFAAGKTQRKLTAEVQIKGKPIERILQKQAGQQSAPSAPKLKR